MCILIQRLIKIFKRSQQAAFWPYGLWSPQAPKRACRQPMERAGCLRYGAIFFYPLKEHGPAVAESREMCRTALQARPCLKFIHAISGRASRAIGMRFSSSSWVSMASLSLHKIKNNALSMSSLKFSIYMLTKL